MNKLKILVPIWRKKYFNGYFKWDEKESCYITEMEQKDGIISAQKSQIEALEYQLNKQKHSIPESMQSPW